jgi:sirohydrochlorin cobaltochelatase
MENDALLIVGHGSRLAEAVAAFNQLVEAVAQRGVYARVIGAHLEFSRPDITSAVKTLRAEGYTQVRVLPYFLYDGKHTRHDIPEILREIGFLFPEMHFSIARPLGFDEAFVEILLKRAQETK